MPRDRLSGTVLLVSLTALTAVAIAGGQPFETDSDSAATESQQAERIQPGQLRPLNSVVGTWRGVGQPKRGSRAGAWQEKTVCRWDFSGDVPAVRFDAENGRQFQMLVLTVSGEGKLSLLQQVDRDQARTYTGSLPDTWPGKIRLLSEPDLEGAVFRCTIEQLSEIRLVVLFERRATANGSFRRIAGIGYTRSGHRLARGGGNQRECVVTGGLGTIPVTHNGRTWYVCCEGCRQAFDDAPQEIIADYLNRSSESNDGQ